MSKKSLVDSIEIKSPCSEDWDTMKGNEKMRFCSHCSKHVSNLSEMTRKQAMRLVRESNGRLCVRYIKNPSNNQPVFADKFYQITRRAGLAAGVLGASLTLSTLAYAQGAPLLKLRNSDALETQTSNEKDKTESKTGIVQGTITDENGAVIPNVSVTLTNSETKNTRAGSSDENGFYEFRDVEAGRYEVNFLSLGFKAFNEEIVVSETRTAEVSPVMKVDGERNVFVMGDMAAVEYRSALHQAVANDNFEEVQNLIAKGADINQKDENYNDITPLFLAVENGNVKIAEYLLGLGAEINAADSNKQTPLMRIDSDASAELVRLLIGYGANLAAVDDEGNTPLILAANLTDTKILQVLIESGANVNAQNKEGQTALMNAANNDNLESVRALLVGGADPNLRNKSGDTAWDFTSSEEIETLLESYGAKAEEN